MRKWRIFIFNLATVLSNGRLITRLTIWFLDQVVVFRLRAGQSFHLSHIFKLAKWAMLFAVTEIAFRT